MRDYLNITDSPTSYCGIIQKIDAELSDLNPISDEGRSFIEQLQMEFHTQVANNRMPILFIGGIENKERYLSFTSSEPKIAQFGVNLSNHIKLGDYNLLVNLCAEEHFKNTGNYPEWMESELKGTSSQCKNYILQDEFNGLQSDLYENIKTDLVGSGEITIDETAEMYNTVVSNIKNHILANSVLSTPEGQRFFDENITQIFESKTPLLDLREFKTNAQQVASHDPKLMDILKFVNKNVKNSPSLNVLLNLAKEEHLQNTNRANHPEDDETLAALKNYWSAGDSEIEQGIKNGTFDSLKSNLMMNLRSDFVPDSKGTKIVNVPQQAPLSKLMESIQDLQVFSPIGVLWDDTQQNQKYAFIEDDVFQVSQDGDNILYQSVNPERIQNIPSSLTRFTQAFKELAYNPQTLKFTPALADWDFTIEINETGEIILKESDLYSETEAQTTVELDDVKSLFVETLELFKTSGIVAEKIAALQRDADNFVIVALNYKKLFLFDDLIQIQSLNENTYAIVPGDTLKLTSEDKQEASNVSIISGTVDKTTTQYKSYQELVNAINRNIGLKTENSVTQLYESVLSTEYNKNFDRQSQIGALKEQQSSLNLQIQSKNNLLKLADENSPAQQKLQQELDLLNTDLDKNLTDMNYYVNDFDVLKEPQL